MKIHSLALDRYEIRLTTGTKRQGALIHIVDEEGREGCGEIAPLPLWNPETIDQALSSIDNHRDALLAVDWTVDSWQEQLLTIELPPSASFGFESALLMLIDPLEGIKVPFSCLLMRTPEEIMLRADMRIREGFTSAKLKVGNLSFQQAYDVIDQLKDKLRLRVDVNRAWETEDAIRFFSRYPTDAFDYVEEPFSDPKQLSRFTHPFAVDETFRSGLSFDELVVMPKLKALIYKPTMSGGIAHCSSLVRTAKELGLSVVLSSSFESDVGLAHLAMMAHRLQLRALPGLGTYHYLEDTFILDSASSTAEFRFIGEYCTVSGCSMYVKPDMKNRRLIDL